MAFVIAVFIVLVTLYLPGFLLGRAFAMPRYVAVATAPAISIPLIIVLGIALYMANVSCHAMVLLALCLIVSLVVRGICFATTHKRAAAADTPARSVSPLNTSVPTRTASSLNLSANSSSHLMWLMYALYIAIACIVCAIMFLTAIDGFDSFGRKYDTATHISLVRTFLETGTYSTLHCDSFIELDQRGGYYPCTWHLVCAIAASCVSNNVDIATNATTLVFCAVVYPLAVGLLLKLIFPQNKFVLIAGAFFTTTFAIFPWGFLTKGQLLSNLASYAVIPCVLAMILLALQAHPVKRRAIYIVGAVWGLCAVAFAQPNGAFTCGIWIVCSLLGFIFYSGNRVKAALTTRNILIAFGLVASACIVWVACFFAPPLQNVVTYGTWDVLLSLPAAAVAGLSFMFVNWGGVQPLISVVVLLGVIRTFRERRFLWLTLAYFLAFIIYLFNMSTDGILRQLFSGFWYSDYYRTAAMNAVFALPLAAFGTAWCIQGLENVILRITKKRIQSGASTAISATLVGIVIAAGLAYPFSISVGSRTIEAGLPTMRAQIASLYSWDSVYTSEEKAFVQQVAAIIPSNEYIINIPNDGSAWCYGTDGIPVAYRLPSTGGGGPFTDEAKKLVRLQLCDIATNAEVQQAIKDMSARYVMLLDDSTSANPTIEPLRYNADDWAGIAAITPETPGFTLVLSEGDMRLYEIDVMN